jgi:hypothetical protein
MSAISDARASAKKRRADVTAKINRLSRVNNADVGGTQYDPRLPVGAVNSMTTRQAKSYQNKLNSFMSRSNSFVGGSDRAAIPSANWRRYKSLERAYNRKSDSVMAAIGDISLKPTGNDLTIRERDSLMTPSTKKTMGQASSKPFSPVSRKASNVTGVESLDKLSKSLEKKLNANYLPKALKASRVQAGQMVDGMGLSRSDNINLKKEIRDLSDDQFNVLWSYTEFPKKLSIAMVTSKNPRDSMVNANSGDRYSANVLERSSDDVRTFLDWSKTLTPEQTGTKRSTSGKSTKARKTPRRLR